MKDSKKINIKDIPQEFIINSLTRYQVQDIEMRYYIFNRYIELSNSGWGKYTIYSKIAEEVCRDSETVRKICCKLFDNIINNCAVS